MKFGKSLSNQIEETLPEWRDKFLSYKELKKCLKRIRPSPSPSPSPSPPHHTNTNDADADADAYTGLLCPSKRPRLNPPPHAATDDDYIDHHNASAVAVAISSSSSSSPTQHTSSSSAAAAAGGGGATATATTVTPEEFDFMRLLEEELDKFNTFFLEKEEEYVIRQKDLQDRMLAAFNDSKEDLMKEIVDFHGEMVLLENYSALNYTGLVKILKKYDKRTGALLRLPFIQKVLQQPFFTTDVLYKLVKECETMLDCLFPAKESFPAAEANGFLESTKEEEPPEPGASSIARNAIPELEEIEHMESLYMKSTVAALRVLKEIRKGSSTVSVFSLPPLQSTNWVEDRWGKIPVLEQEAK